jgi:hypothetical protein
MYKKNHSPLRKKFTQSSQKYGFLIRDPVKTYPGSRGQKGSRSRIILYGLSISACMPALASITIRWLSACAFSRVSWYTLHTTQDYFLFNDWIGL